MSGKSEYTCNFKTIARRFSRTKLKDILDEANNDNEKHIALTIPKFRTNLKAPDVKSSSDAKSNGDDEILMMKTTAETLISDDSDIKEYYEGVKTRLNKRKIEEIYSIVSPSMPYESFKPKFKKGNGTSKRFIRSKTTNKTSFEDGEFFTFEQASLTDVDEYSEEITDIAVTSDTVHDESESDGTESSTQLSFDMVDEINEKNKKDDINLKIAFDMINSDSDESDDTEAEDSSEDDEGLLSKLFRYRSTSDNEQKNEEDENAEYTEAEDDEYNGFEYETPRDKEESFKLLKNSVNQAFRKLCLSSLFFVLLLAFQIFSVKSETLANYFSYNKYGIIYILIEVQLLFLSVAVHKGAFINGIRSFFKGKFSPECIFSTTVIFSTVHSVVSIFNQSEGIRLFNPIVALTSVFIGISTYLKCKKNLSTFRIISTNETKYAAAELSPASKEASSFYEYLLEDSDVYTVSKTKFVSSFFSRISKRPQGYDILNAIIPGVFFIAAVIFSVCYFYREMTVFNSFTAMTAFICSTMPATSFFVITLPLFSANNACKKIDSALIGESVTEEYSNASVISFEDKELFPSSKITMTNIKVYHNVRLDQIILELARIFSHVGGPLKDFFAQSASGAFEEHEVIQIIESSENGIMIAADGNDYYLGNGEFMRSHGLQYDEDADDQKHERHGESVLVFGANLVVAAKLYFEYLPQKGFRKLLDHMYKSGLCIGIKTLDPNINNSLLAYHADDSQCPISILKVSSPEDLESKSESVDTGIVSKRSLGALLKTFTICDKARHSIKSNGIIMLLGSILTSIMMIFIAITGGIASFTPMHAFLLQTLWSAIILFLSFLK